MTEREAGRRANTIYAAVNAKQITRRQALALLERLMPYLSTTQYNKFMDFDYACKHNPHLLDQ